MNKKILLMLASLLILASMNGVNALSGETRWYTPDFSNGSRLDFVWGYTCFGEGPAVDRIKNDTVQFENRDIINFSVFLTGFNMWYPSGDHPEAQNRIDVWNAGILDMYNPNSPIKYGQVAALKFEYSMADDAPTGDRNSACVGVCVIALTRPCQNCT